MHSATAYSLLAAALGANARSILSSRGSQCCSFTLSVNGKPVYNNPTDAHQVAYGGSQPGSSTEFCIDSQGQITDAAGICGITQNTGNPSGTTQFQCDANMMSNFTIDCSGNLEYNGSPSFYGCLASNSIGYNIYASPPTTAQCASGSPQKIKVMTSGCHSQCQQQQQSKCPGELGNEWQYPHLIVPVSKSSPNKAAGTSYDGQVTSDISSIFNFDVPASYKGMTCTVVFDFPTQSELVTSSYTVSGSGAVDFALLSGTASASTTSANAPKVAKDLGSQNLAPGNSYTVWSGACSAGNAVAFEMSTTTSTCLEWFQDYNECPIGMYMLANKLELRKVEGPT